MGAAAATAQPVRVAVWPFPDPRQAEGTAWSDLFWQELLSDALLRSGKAAVQDPRTARLWAAKLRRSAQEAPTAEERAAMGVDAVVQGSAQTVLSMTRLQVRVTGAGGTRLEPPQGRIEFNRDRESPPEVARRLLALVAPALGVGDATEPPPLPERWAPLQRYYGEVAQPLDARSRPALDARVAALEPMLGEPALRSRIATSLALLHLMRGQLHEAPGPLRQQALRTALQLVESALAAEPWRGDPRTLKAEVLYFLKDFDHAKVEATAARQRNPQDGLALAVAGLAAGLSTGEAKELLRQAFRVDPFLAAEARPPGSPPLQGGLLEPLWQRWRALGSKAGIPRSPAFEDAIGRGSASFKAEEWEQAEAAFNEALQIEENSHVPLLYLYRILIETDRAALAVPVLRNLAAEFPQEADVHYWLGIALERTEQFGDARQAFLRATIENPNHLDALFHAGTAAMAEKQWQDALESFAAVLRQDPRHAQALLRQGIARAQLQQWEGAEESLRRALELDPANTEAAEWRRKVAPRLQAAAHAPAGAPKQAAPAMP
ncbi:MAG: tetratricopeptide repeat protein [Candidatus Lambdaproteobacteria bacterium]|nr:tetratricopeptide repeat protein [Candidatus Lambdaproteobacteria bacterium]